MLRHPQGNSNIDVEFTALGLGNLALALVLLAQRNPGKSSQGCGLDQRGAQDWRDTGVRHAVRLAIGSCSASGKPRQIVAEWEAEGEGSGG